MSTEDRASPDSLEEMALSPEEIEELRARVRAELEAEEARRQRYVREREPRTSARAMRIRQIEREEEERFYRERGYRRFVDRAGHVRWLSPEQAQRWEEERQKRRRRSRSLSGRVSTPKARQLLATGIMVGALTLFALFLALLRRG